MRISREGSGEAVSRLGRSGVTKLATRIGGEPPKSVSARDFRAAVSGKAAPMARMQAKGRLPDGAMNATETRYAAHLGARMAAGEVAWFKFEPFALKLAPKTTLTPDFAVMLADGTLEVHDVKGAKAIYTDDAKVKMKVAAQMFPFKFVVVFPAGRDWNMEAVS